MKKILLLTAIGILTFSCVSSASSINNSGFESSELGDGFDIPSGWHVENYCAVISNFLPDAYPGDKSAWQIDTNAELTAYEGSKFALISNGDSSVSYGRMSQQITVHAGDIITGAYFFGTCDYVPWDDYAEIRLVAADSSGLENIILVHISVADVSNYGSTDGWVTFQSEAFTYLNCGTYTLECSVNDTADYQLESYFAIDALHIIPEPASVMLLLSGLCLLGRKK